MPIVSYQDLRDWLGLGSDVDVALITELEVRAVAFIEGETGRFFGATGTTHTEYLAGTGAVALYLKETADTLTSVEERQQPGDTWTAIASADADGWEQRGHRLLRKGGSVWVKGYEYRVIYDFGYTAGSEPQTIKQLVRDLVKLKYDERLLNVAVTSEAVGPERYTRAEFAADVANLAWVKAILDRFRRQHVDTWQA